MDNRLWEILITVLALVGTYFFAKWNKSSENSERLSNRRAEDGNYKSERSCEHSRNNCTNIFSLQMQQLSAQVLECRTDIQTTKAILLIIAVKSGVEPTELTGLTK
jgi:hypothetical protein